MKAIETKYEGRRFRSRLEARWAVFFDALKIKWEYEPQSFYLSGGRGYLPDFRLIENDVYVEIKPSPSTDADWEKPYLFAADKPIVLIAGEPRIGRNDSLLLPYGHKWSEYAYSNYADHLECSSYFSNQGITPKRILERTPREVIRQQVGAVKAALSARFGVYE